MSMSTSTPQGRLWAGIRWISIVIAVGIVIMAMLIGQGVWGGERNLIPGHGHLGNTLFVLSIVQFVLAIVLYQRKAISAGLMVLIFAVVILFFAQVGIGYSGRGNASLISWHVPLGVLLMGLSTINATLAWVRPGSPAARQA
jgi:hypothetical protein